MNAQKSIEQKGVDLETWRVEQGLTYEELAKFLGLKSKYEAYWFSIGHEWPRLEIVEKIITKTNGAVTEWALAQRRFDHVEMGSNDIYIIPDVVAEKRARKANRS